MSDREYVALVSELSSGVGQWAEVLKPYEKVKDDLSVVDGVVMYNGRILVPGPLTRGQQEWP